MITKLLTLGCALIVALCACGNDEPENYGGIPKQTLDKVAKDAEQATEDAKKKIDGALKQLE